MEFQEYVDGLRNAEVPIIRPDFGLQDNFPLFIRANYVDVIEGLMYPERGIFSGRYNTRQGRIDPPCVDYPQGIEMNSFQTKDCRVIFSVQTPVAVCDCTFDGFEGEHYTRQRRDFNINFCFHPKRQEDGDPPRDASLTWQESMRTTVLDVVDYATREKIPLCFPQIEVRLGRPGAIIKRGKDEYEWASLSSIYYYP